MKKRGTMKVSIKNEIIINFKLHKSLEVELIQLNSLICNVKLFNFFCFIKVVISSSKRNIWYNYVLK